MQLVLELFSVASNQCSDCETRMRSLNLTDSMIRLVRLNASLVRPAGRQVGRVMMTDREAGRPSDECSEDDRQGDR